MTETQAIYYVSDIEKPEEFREALEQWKKDGCPMIKVGKIVEAYVPDRMMYHCPRCGKWKTHTQQVFSAADEEHEYLTCYTCGNVLHFKRNAPNA